MPVSNGVTAAQMSRSSSYTGPRPGTARPGPAARYWLR
jgi:hypothetical protein